MISASSVHEAQRGQLSIIFDLLRPKACYIARYSPKNGDLQVAGSRGRADARIAATRPGEGPVGQAFLQRQVIRSDGVIAVPLSGTMSVAGCLAILSPQYDASDLMLMALAAQISAASEVAYLRDEMARQNKDLQTALTGVRSLQKGRELMLSNVSHELKNPLTPIKVYLNMFARGSLGEVSPRQAHALSVIERNADRLVRMISDLVLISRLQSGKMSLHTRAFGLKSLAERVMETLNPTAGQASVRLTLAASPEVFVRGDQERIGDAIYNLVENAILAAGQQGEVEVAVSSRTGFAVLSVRDNGPGIHAEDQERVFDAVAMGAAARPPSSIARRLGLATVAEIVQLHGGRAEVKSKLGHGSTFRIYLPLFAAAAAAPEKHVASATKGDILLVEDNADVREVLKDVLEEHGYSVIASSTAAQALSLLSQSKPALVLLDWRLSDDDGRSVLNFIRFTPSLSKTPVFIISGASQIGPLSSEQGPERVDGFFEKPLNLAKLMNAVASVVRSESGSAHKGKVPSKDNHLPA